jgi:hypothetical protein
MGSFVGPAPPGCAGRLGRGFHLEFFRPSGFDSGAAGGGGEPAAAGVGLSFLSEEGTRSGAGRRLELDPERWCWREASVEGLGRGSLWDLLGSGDPV